METAIRWSPSSTTTEQRFLIADVNGRAFRYCAVEHYDKKEFRYETLSTHHKVPAFRAFDWSPHDEAIVAVGQWSGEATVLRIDDQSQSLSLPIRHQRLCNAVSFSRTGLLATGLERVRNDFCLNVWDISQRLSAKSSSSTGPGKTSMDPVRKLASSEAITSIKFFPSQPDVLVCGVKGVSIRIYDTRDHTGNPSFHFHTSCVNNIAIDPLDENYFASAGPVKDTTIHLFDRRWSSSTAANIATNATNGNQHGPILEFRKAFDNPNSSALPSVWSLRYCKGQSGCLAALASTGEYKIFETKKEHISETGSLKGQQTALNEPISYPQKLLTKRIHHVERAFDDKNHRRSENKRIVSFDFTNLAGSNGRPCTITVRGNQTIEIYELQGPSPSLSVSPMGTIAISKATPGTGFSSNHSVTLDEFAYMIRPLEAETIAMSLKNIRTKLNDELSARPEQNLGTVENAEGFNRAPDKKPHLSSREAHEAMNFHPSNVTLGMRDALDMFTISRRRCAEGYLFDSKKNCDILSDDPWLQDLWTWIGRAKRNAENEDMVAEGIDLSYLGIFNIWNNDLGIHKATRKVGNVGDDMKITSAISSICDGLELPDSSPRETAYPRHRQLCLHTCGLGLPYQQLEESVKGLVLQGQNTRAAALAIIHDQPKLAFLALRNGSATVAHRELSLALAGFVKGVTDDTWEETVREVAKELEDPYARAILALVSYGDWHDVLAETSLPLRDRVGVALMYLEDQELGQYIMDATNESIRQGDIEGIVLTGLSEKSIPLFEAYMHKFADLQTPVLALSHTCPRYFSSPLVNIWRESYRTSLNTYRLFLQRVHFDVGSTKLSTGPGQKPSLPPPPRQVSIRCNNCDQALDRNPENMSSSPPAPGNTGFGIHQGSIFGDQKSGTVCPKCGRHLPRCVICMMWLGMPDPSSKGAAAMAETKKDPLEDFVAVCRGCWHMSHGAHIREWFNGHDVCPVPDCDCRCGEVDGLGRV